MGWKEEKPLCSGGLMIHRKRRRAQKGAMEEVTRKELSKSTLRKYVFITLTHAETREKEVSKAELFKRVKGLAGCQAIVMATEKHEDGGYHYHIVVKTSGASKNNALRRIRNLFPEFEGRQCDIKFPKGWGPVLAYVTKEDRDPAVWGQFSREQILEIARDASKKRRCKVDSRRILSELEECETWWDVYDNPELKERLLQGYTNMKKIHEDFEYLKARRRTIGTKIVDFLELHKSPSEYTPEYLKEKYVLLDWIACQLVFRRPIKSKQLYIYGEPSVQKTLIFSMLAKVVRIYFASSRKGDFSGADNLYDLWLFDEFHEQEESTFGAATDTGTAFANTLLKVLDGQECRLDSKYARVFTKKCNVPIVMIGNTLPKGLKSKGALQERFMRLRFANVMENLDEARLVATLWGCIQRRLERQLNLKRQKGADLVLKYNNVAVYPAVKDYMEMRRICNPEELERMREEILGEGEQTYRTHDGELLTERGSCQLKEWQKDYYDYREYPNRWARLYVWYEDLRGELLSTLNFAVIPLAKCDGVDGGGYPKGVRVFKTLGAEFRIHRFKSDKKSDYMAWPLHIELPEHEELVDEWNENRACNVKLELLQREEPHPEPINHMWEKPEWGIAGTLHIGPMGTGGDPGGTRGGFWKNWSEND
jgi:hypothetical protein